MKKSENPYDSLPELRQSVEAFVKAIDPTHPFLSRPSEKDEEHSDDEDDKDEWKEESGQDQLVEEAMDKGVADKGTNGKSKSASS